MRRRVRRLVEAHARSRPAAGEFVGVVGGDATLVPWSGGWSGGAGTMCWTRIRALGWTRVGAMLPVDSLSRRACLGGVGDQDARCEQRTGGEGKTGDAPDWPGHSPVGLHASQTMSQMKVLVNIACSHPGRAAIPLTNEPHTAILRALVGDGAMAGDDLVLDFGVLTPNALLVVAAIDALNGTGVTSSPKSDDVAWAVGKDAAWVHRHGNVLCGIFGWHEVPRGEGADADAFDELAATPEAQRMARPEREPVRWALRIADLSPNGHCSLSTFGQGLARKLRSARPAQPAPASCRRCGAAPAGEVVAGRQIYACGRVDQWCPDAIPDMERAQVPARSRKAQHEGMWFRAMPCSGSKRRTDVTADGSPLAVGLQVSASFGSGAHQRYGQVAGTVRAHASGVALVDWPETERGGALTGDAILGERLVVPGAPDPTGLSDYQARLWDAIRRDQVLLEVSDTGVYLGKFERRAIGARALEVLIEHRLLAPPPAPPVPRSLFADMA